MLVNNVNDFSVNITLHIEIPEAALEKMSYQYPYANFNCELSKGIAYITKLEELISYSSICNELPLSINDEKEILVDIDNLDDELKILYNLTSNNIYRAIMSIDDIGYSDKIISVGIQLLQ